VTVPAVLAGSLALLLLTGQTLNLLTGQTLNLQS